MGGRDGVYQVAGGLPGGQQLVRVACLETYPGKEGGRRPTGPTDSHTGEPRADDWSAPWYMRSQQHSLPLLPGARAGNGLAIQTRALWGAEDPGGAYLGRGKEYSPHSSSKPAPQREGLAGRKDLGYWAERPRGNPLAGPAFSAVWPGTSARVAASSELKGSLGGSHRPPRDWTGGDGSPGIGLCLMQVGGRGTPYPQGPLGLLAPAGRA